MVFFLRLRTHEDAAIHARMIHYHGTPITPDTAAARALASGHAFVSFFRPDQLGLVLEFASSFALDNGAYSSWRSGKPVDDWRLYYEWVGELHRYPSFDFAVIPDVITGTEAENDALIEQWPWQHAKHIGAPVWHLHESLERLERLALNWPRICFGSSGEFAQVGSPAWWDRMAQAMNVVTNREGLPICKLHGLRMLNPAVYQQFPFASADSTNLARNIGIDCKWVGGNRPATKDSRATILRERIEAYQSPTFWNRQPTQMRMFA